MKEINLDQICKIEGHASLKLKIEKNKVKVCELEAQEGARFFEALVLGKNIDDVQEIVSRICGICSSSHSVCAIQALEKAIGIEPNESQKALRELLILGERLRSHATHLYFLSLPDYYGFSSALDMAKEHKEKIDDALTLITLGNKIVSIVGGREIHPFIKIKESMKNLEKAKEAVEEIEKVKPIIIRTIKLFSSLDYPKLERDTDYFSLHENDCYAATSGRLKSASGLIDSKDYKKHLKEDLKEYATSKFALKDGKPFVVGAIARIKNNQENLDFESRKLLGTIKIDMSNPFHNNLAQAIEMLQIVNRVKDLILRINENEPEEIKIKPGHAVSAVEAPRGTLFHEYKVSSEGKITYCNIITPTVQNLSMMEQDITRYVDLLLEKKVPKEKIVNEIEKLIRAYDPCFSCSTHFLKVNWI